jgi:hypothetical protein
MRLSTFCGLRRDTEHVQNMFLQMFVNWGRGGGSTKSMDDKYMRKDADDDILTFFFKDCPKAHPDRGRLMEACLKTVTAKNCLVLGCGMRALD